MCEVIFNCKFKFASKIKFRMTILHLKLLRRGKQFLMKKMKKKKSRKTDAERSVKPSFVPEIYIFFNLINL